MTLLNSNFEDWRRANADAPADTFKFSPKKLNPAGSLFDYAKLTDVSKNVICKMDAERVYTLLTEWAQEFDPEFGEKLSADPDFAKKILAIGRGGKKPRKDLAVWKDAKPYMGFFYDGFFKIEDEIDEKFDRADVKAVLTQFKETYDEADDMNTWFGKIQQISEGLGYTADMKAYKADPSAFKGNVGDVSMFLRIAVTGKLNSPDMYAVMQILGKDKVFERIDAMLETL